MKVALVHDWLTGLRGGERCLQAFVAMYPQADIFCLIHVPGSTTPQIDAQVKGTSFLQRLPGVAKYYRALLPLYPLAAHSIDLSNYDLVISVSHAAAKNVRVGTKTVHLCYCLTPMRYAWDQARTYFGAATPVLSPLLRHLRQWDKQGSASVDRFIAISRFVAARVRTFYGRRADVIFPPIDPFWFAGTLPTEQGTEFLYAGALVPYKGAELAVDVCTQRDLPLTVAGSGPLLAQLRRRAGPRVHFLGRVSDQKLRELYQSCRALLFPAREDFGMIPLECMAAGRPVIAPYSGATKETVCGLKAWSSVALPPASRTSAPGAASDSLAPTHPTGVFFKHPRQASPRARVEFLSEAISAFEQHEGAFQPAACRARATNFGLRRFFDQWQAIPELQPFRGEGQNTGDAVVRLGLWHSAEASR